METITINNEKYYPIKNWEHRYCVSEKGKFVRIIRDHNCNCKIVREIGNNNARNIVLTEVLMGKKREKAYDKLSIAFDTFYPGKRQEKGKAIRILDGNNKNLSKENLTLSNKNSPSSTISISVEKLKKIKKLREDGKTFKSIKQDLNLNCTTQTIKNKLSLYIKLIS